MKVKYTGPAHERGFTKSDFSSVGLEGSAIRFNERNNWVGEVDDSVGEWLIANEDFREATDDDETEQDLTRVGTTPRSMRAAAPEVVPASPGAVESGAGTSGRARGGRTASS